SRGCVLCRGKRAIRSPPTRTVPRSDRPALEVLGRYGLRSNRARRNLSHRVGQTYLVTLTALAAGMNPARCVRADQFVMNPAFDARSRARLDGVWLASTVWQWWQSLCTRGGIDENPNSSTAANSPRGEESA